MSILEHEKQWLMNKGAQMVATLGIKEGDSVVDFGCGKGRYTIPISQAVKKNGNLLAIERNSDETAVLRERVAEFGKKNVIQILEKEDIQLQSVENGVIDHIFVFDVLQYIDNWELFFNSVHRVLKSTGKIHVYPATIPHPGAVDIEKVNLTINMNGIWKRSEREFEMMHNKDMVIDKVYTFSLLN